MAAGEVHIGDIGTIFLVTFKDGNKLVDISPATTKSLRFKKPDGTELTVGGSFTSSDYGVSGLLQYAAVSGDINQVGTWRVQGYLISSGNLYQSDIGTFKVHPNLF